MAVIIATARHANCDRNMLPASCRTATRCAIADDLRDSSEFVVSKLRDRGTQQAFGVVTNAQDFLHILRDYVARELEAPGSMGVR